VKIGFEKWRLDLRFDFIYLHFALEKDSNHDKSASIPLRSDTYFLTDAKQSAQIVEALLLQNAV